MKISKHIQWSMPFIIFMLLPFLEPQGIVGMSDYLGGIYRYIDSGFTILTVVSCLFICILYFGRKTVALSKILVVILAYVAWLIFSSVINGNFSTGYLITSLKIIGMCMMADFYMDSPYSMRFLKAACLILETWILLNFICIIIFPDFMYVDDRGWGANWLLGYKNLHIYYFIPYIAIKAIIQYFEKSNLTISYYIMIAIILASSILANSTTTFITICVLIICIVFLRRFDLPKMFNSFSIVCISGALSVVFIMFNRIASILTVVEKLFDTNTIYLRNLIWARSLISIAENPIIGKGNFAFELSSFSWKITQTHNKFIDLLITGGIVQVVLFFFLFWIVSKKISDIKQFEYRNIMNFSFALYAILFLTEARRNDYLFFMLIVVAFYLPHLLSKANISGNFYKRTKRRHLKIHF